MLLHLFVVEVTLLTDRLPRSNPVRLRGGRGGSNNQKQIRNLPGLRNCTIWGTSVIPVLAPVGKESRKTTREGYTELRPPCYRKGPTKTQEDTLEVSGESNCVQIRSSRKMQGREARTTSACLVRPDTPKTDGCKSASEHDSRAARAPLPRSARVPLTCASGLVRVCCLASFAS